MNIKVKLLILLNIVFASASAQLAIYNGISIPARDTIYALIVYAEVDFKTGGCPKGLPDKLNGKWPKDENGKTLLPENPNYFLSPSLQDSVLGTITDYYAQASFNDYVILGDYLPDVISVPCSKVKISSTGFNEIKAQIDSVYKDSIVVTANGIPLTKFDMWTPTEPGKPKIKKSDGKIDLVYFIWRNNRFIAGSNTFDFAGYGVHLINQNDFIGGLGVNNVSSFNCTRMAESARVITIAEHLHGIFGGNNWHSAGGRGKHTFMARAASYGATGQFGAVMQAPCGWDRWMMNWKNPDKNHLISAQDLSGNELKSDLKFNDENKIDTFVLRDFMTSGDVIRIKIPHLEWTKPGDVKNQYIWIENRQFETRFDKWMNYECNDNKDGEFPNGTPGMYSYIQVGKDQKEGTRDIYSRTVNMPNALAGWLYPLTAEGNYDQTFVPDSIQKGKWIKCNWNVKNIPLDADNRVENPFTGFNDLMMLIDENNDSIFRHGDPTRIGLSEIKNGKVVHDYFENGDWEDGYSSHTGSMEISLSTNPAPVPVYTYTSNYEFNRFYASNGFTDSYENREIHLNGLNIRLIEERENGDIVVVVKWDDFKLKNDIRWCGQIRLHPNPYKIKEPALVVSKKVSLNLDQGKTPVIHAATQQNPRYIGYYERTVLYCDSGSVLKMKPFSVIRINKNSSLNLQEGSKLKMSFGSKIIIEEGGELNYLSRRQIKRSWLGRIIKK